MKINKNNNNQCHCNLFAKKINIIPPVHSKISLKNKLGLMNKFSIDVQSSKQLHSKLKSALVEPPRCKEPRGQFTPVPRSINIQPSNLTHQISNHTNSSIPFLNSNKSLLTQPSVQNMATYPLIKIIKHSYPIAHHQKALTTTTKKPILFSYDMTKQHNKIDRDTSLKDLNHSVNGKTIASLQRSDSEMLPKETKNVVLKDLRKSKNNNTKKTQFKLSQLRARSISSGSSRRSQNNSQMSQVIESLLSNKQKSKNHFHFESTLY